MRNAELPYQKSSTSSIENNEIRAQIEKLNDEKNSLMESLRNEMICNEEQRNYIQVLINLIQSSFYMRNKQFN